MKTLVENAPLLVRPIILKTPRTLVIAADYVALKMITHLRQNFFLVNLPLAVTLAELVNLLVLETKKKTLNLHVPQAATCAASSLIPPNLITSCRRFVSILEVNAERSVLQRKKKIRLTHVITVHVVLRNRKVEYFQIGR